MKRGITITAWCLLTVASTGAPVFANPAAQLVKALTKWASKETVGEAAEKVVREVGEETLERVGKKIVVTGGKESMERVTKLVVQHGPDVLRVIDRAPSAGRVLKALEDLPADQVQKAAARLIAGKTGKELIESTTRYGAIALRAELKHPGIGGKFVRELGTDGASLCTKLGERQAVALSKYVDDIADMPLSQRKELLELVDSKPEGFFKWLGEFAQNNPGKTIGSVTFLAVFLPNSDRILGGGEIVYDKDGNPTVISKQGVIAGPIMRPVEKGLGSIFRVVTTILAVFLGGIAGIKMWSTWQRERIRIAAEQHRNRAQESQG